MSPHKKLPASLRLILTVVVFATSALLQAAERDSLRLLAIGNSFSEDATAFLPSLAKAGGKNLVIARASIGGCPLELHARHLREAEAGDPKGKAYNGRSLPEILASQPWDVVTLQQWSQLSFKPKTFQPFADELIAAIHKYAPTAEIVVHETWAYREDHPWFQKNDGFTPAKMYAGARDTYRAFADGKGFRLIPVGDALNIARQTPRWTFAADPKFDYKNPAEGQLPDQSTSLNIGWRWTKNKDGKNALSLDAIHCNVAGRYLGASVWYQTLFETETVPETYAPQGLAAADAADLRLHALAAVKAERAREKSPAQPAAAK